MRKTAALFIALCLLLTAVPALAETYTFPYQGDPITYQYFDYDWTNDMRTYDGKIDQLLQEKLGNVKIEVVRANSADFGTRFNVMMASGDLLDINTCPGSVASWVNQYGASGYLLNISDYLDLMPNYQAEAAVYPGTFYTYEGDVYGLEQMYHGSIFAFLFHWNNYWTAKYGIQPPTTTDELLDVMRQVKQINPASYPHMSWSGSWLNQMCTIFLGLDPWAVTLGGGGAVKYDWDDTGKWIYSINRKGLKEMIDYMHTQYEEELIPKDFLTMPGDAIDTILYGSGDGWCVYTCWPVPTNFESMYPTVQAKFPEYSVKYIVAPIWEGRGISYSWPNVQEGTGTGGFVLSAEAQKPDLLCSTLDYLISDDIDTLIHWGIEGETFTVDENGKKHLADNIKTAANPDGTVDIARDYGWYPHINYKQLSWITSNRSSWEVMILTDNTKPWMDCFTEVADYMKAHPEGTIGYRNPPSMTEDEAEEINMNLGPINTYVAEQLTKFVLGERSMDEWDAFMAEWQTYGDIDRVLEIYNQVPVAPLKAQ